MKTTCLVLFLAVLAGIGTAPLSGCAGLNTACRTEEPAPGGVSEGTGRGYRGTIRVNVRMDGGTITEILVVDSGEDSAVGGAAIEELTELVLMYNTTDLDAVSGATESSEGFLAAVENAILRSYE